MTKRPAVDLDINFDYNSAALTPTVEPQLNSLGSALTSPALLGSVIMLAATPMPREATLQPIFGRRPDVQPLSQVKTSMTGRIFVTAGYGKQGMKNPNDPFAAENRRVQISNVEGRDEASR